MGLACADVEVVATSAEIARLTTEALFLVLLVSAPVLLVSMFVGLVVGLLQAVTQVQEQTLAFVPKLAAVAIALTVAGAWMGGELIHFTRELWQNISALAI